MPWDVDFTAQAEAWLQALARGQRTGMARQLDKLQASGPTLGRPTVDTVHGSRHRNMKELRLPGTPVRALFAFGPDRRALILTGASKAGRESRFYREQIRVADELFTRHLRTFAREGACRDTRAGSRSGGRQM